MLRLFLRLYFTSKLKKIFSYICIILIIWFVTVIFEDHFVIPPVTYLIFFISFVFSLFLYLEFKEKKICIISDTMLKQKKYYDESGLEASRNRKFTTGYRKWLILTITENNPDIVKTQFFIGDSSYYCLYCYFSVIPIIIMFVFINMYANFSQTILIILIVVISIITLGIIGARRHTIKRCKQIDSEIKRILFEEETGYNPLIKGKYTFKYKAWLKLKEEKMSIVPYRD